MPPWRMEGGWHGTLLCCTKAHLGCDGSAVRATSSPAPENGVIRGVRAPPCPYLQLLTACMSFLAVCSSWWMMSRDGHSIGSRVQARRLRAPRHLETSLLLPPSICAFVRGATQVRVIRRTPIICTRRLATLKGCQLSLRGLSLCEVSGSQEPRDCAGLPHTLRPQDPGFRAGLSARIAATRMLGPCAWCRQAGLPGVSISGLCFVLRSFQGPLMTTKAKRSGGRLVGVRLASAMTYASPRSSYRSP